MNPADRPGAGIYLGVSIAAGTGLAYEVLLLRVFSFSQWHHFASLAVSLALLGFGTAGTCLTLLGSRAVRWGDRLFIAGLVSGALGMVAAFLLPQVLSVRPLFAVWNANELFKLLVIDFVSFLPFFGLALCLGQVFMRYPGHTPRLYAADLLGAGLGSIGATLLLSNLFLEEALMVLPVLALATAGFIAVARSRMRVTGTLAFAAATALAIWIALGLPQLPLSDFKRLAYLLDLPDARIVEEHPGLREKVTVVRSDSIRMAPGLSLQWMQDIPSQDALVLGSDYVLPMPRGQDLSVTTAYLQASLASLPFVLRSQGRVAILGTGPELPLFLAREHPTDWVEPNPRIRRSFSGRYPLQHVSFHSDPPRRFLTVGQESFSIVFFAAAASESDATGEDYLLTVEGLQAALNRLEPGGLLAIPTPLNNPPRYLPRHLAMAADALRMNGVSDPSQNAAFLRSMASGLLLLSNNPLNAGDCQVVRDFASRWSFDIAALPGLDVSQANRFHRLSTPVFFHIARAFLAGDHALPPEASWYSNRLATDRRPYFWQSMQWSNVPALLNQFGRQGLVWLDWSLLATIAKVVVAGLLAAVLILLPQGRLPRGSGAISRLNVWIYFTGLGLGFLLLEMAAFQRAILYVGHPVPAASLIFAVFLIGSGLGSLTAPDDSTLCTVRRIFLPIGLFGFIAFVSLHAAAPVILSLPDWGRLATVGLLVFPLAVSLGRAMPWGLRQLDTSRPLIPWAWGINGFASVLAGPLAVLLSVHFGQVTTAIAAAVCYGAASTVALRWTRPLINVFGH